MSKNLKIKLEEKKYLQFFIIVITSIFFILIYFHSWKTMNPPFDDARGYLNEAYNLLEQKNITSVERPPGYPLFLATLFMIAGKNNWRVLLFVHLILRAITILLAYSLLLKTTKSFILSYGAIILLWTPAFLVQTRFIYTETLAAFCAIVSLYYYFLAIRQAHPKLTTYLYLYLFISAIFCAFLALIRPVYQALIPVWWIVEIIRMKSHKIFRQWCFRTFVSWLMPFFIIILGWSFRNYKYYKFFGLNALLGFNMTTRTVSVIERLPDTYALERQILIKARNKMLLEPNQGHKAYLYWGHAVHELQKATKMDIPQLSKRLIRINIELIKLAPLNYLYEVVAAFSTFWLPHVDPSESFGRKGQAFFSIIQLLIVIIFLLCAMIFFTIWILWRELDTSEYQLLGKQKNLLSLNWNIIIFVMYTAILSSLIEIGSPRYRVPVDPLIVVSMLSLLNFVLQARKSLLDNK